MDIFEFIFPRKCLGCSQKIEEKILCDVCQNFFFLDLNHPGVEWDPQNPYLIQQIWKNPFYCEDWLFSILLLCLSHPKYQFVEVLIADSKGPLWNPLKKVSDFFGWKLEAVNQTFWDFLQKKSCTQKIKVLVEVGNERGALRLREIPKKLFYLSLFKR